MPKALLTYLNKGEVLIIFITLPLTCVCNVLINDNQVLLNTYFDHNGFRNKVMELMRKITKYFKILKNR